MLAGERAAQLERGAHDGVDRRAGARRDRLVVDEQVDVQVAVAGVAVGGDRQAAPRRRWRRSRRSISGMAPRGTTTSSAILWRCSSFSVGLARRRVSHRSRRSRSFCATSTSTAPAASHAWAQRRSACVEPLGIAVELAEQHRAGAVGQAIGRAPAQVIDGRAIEQLERARPRAEVDRARHRLAGGDGIGEHRQQRRTAGGLRQELERQLGGHGEGALASRRAPRSRRSRSRPFACAARSATPRRPSARTRGRARTRA